MKTLIYIESIQDPKDTRMRRFIGQSFATIVTLLFLNIPIVECMLPSYTNGSRLIHWNSRVPNFMCQGKHHTHFRQAVSYDGSLGGDFLKGDGTGSFSIYGDKFPVNAANSTIHHLRNFFLKSFLS